MFKWRGLLILSAGLGGVYFSLKALITISWLVAFSLVLVLLSIIGVLIGVTVYGFIVLGGRCLAKKELFYITLLCIIGIVIGWRFSDVALISVNSIASLLFIGLSLTIKPGIKVPLSIIKATTIIGMVLAITLLIIHIILPIVSSIATGWGLNPVFDGTRIYIPGPIGYRGMETDKAITRLEINGSKVKLYLINGRIVEGFIEKISKWILWIITRLGRIIINLNEFNGQLNIDAPPTPAPSHMVSTYNGPPPVILWSIRLSSTLSMQLSPIILVALNIIYGFISVTVGLLVLGKEV